MLSHVLFVSQTMRRNFYLYSDVVLFDRSVAVNRFNLPAVMLSGVDCNGRNRLFAFALIKKEAHEDFVWMLQRLAALV